MPFCCQSLPHRPSPITQRDKQTIKFGDHTQLLQTIPGIDQMGAAMLLVEISADMDSFGSAEKLASWVGICPGTTRVRASARAAKPAKAMPRSDDCYANSPKRPAEVVAP